MVKPILTLTLNPSVDISYQLPTLALDTVNRVTTVSKTAGGKGLNVARVLSLLEQEVYASGFLGGTLGKFISQALPKDAIEDKFMQIAGETRNCIAILHDDGQQTEILESGPVISQTEAQNFFNHLISLLPKVDLMTISGSLPKGLDSDFYAQLISLADQYNVKTILDSSGPALLASLNGSTLPFLIKPNQDEINQITHQKIDSLEQLAKLLLTNSNLKNIPWVVVSLGAKGALAKVKDKLYLARIPKITAINPVGSGDSTVAGLAYALNQQNDPKYVLKTAMTCGILNTLNPKTGVINPDLFDVYFKQVEIEEMKLKVTL